MPLVSDRFGPFPLTVTLDGSGNGTVSFQATGKHLHVTNIYVSVATTTLQATATIYKGYIGPAYAINGTNSGSTGAPGTGVIDLLDGEFIHVVWVGGDAGALATATFSGYAVPFDSHEATSDTFVWANPIAAGDGSLVYPALKSPNFVSGTSGWMIDRTGGAEFNNVTVRGTVEAGGGNVRLNVNGLHITNGTTHQYDINGAAGFLARRFIDDGSNVQMTIINSPSHTGGYIGLGIETPTPVNATSMDTAILSASYDTVGAVDSPYIRIDSPNVTGKDPAFIVLHGVKSDDSPSRVELWGDDFYHNTVDQGRGWFTNVSDFANSAAIAGVETAVLTTNNMTWGSSRAYRCIVDGGFSTSVGTNRPIWRLRKTNTAGQLLAFAHGAVSPAAAGSNTTLYMSQVFTVASGGVTAQLVLTLIGSGVFTATMTGGNGGRTMDFIDVGPASRYPDAFTLV